MILWRLSKCSFEILFPTDPLSVGNFGYNERLDNDTAVNEIHIICD
jgi:hypothetical protein